MESWMRCPYLALHFLRCSSGIFCASSLRSQRNLGWRATIVKIHLCSKFPPLGNQVLSVVTGVPLEKMCDLQRLWRSTIFFQAGIKRKYLLQCGMDRKLFHVIVEIDKSYQFITSFCYSCPKLHICNGEREREQSWQESLQYEWEELNLP